MEQFFQVEKSTVLRDGKPVLIRSQPTGRVRIQVTHMDMNTLQVVKSWVEIAFSPREFSGLPLDVCGQEIREDAVDNFK